MMARLKTFALPLVSFLIGVSAALAISWILGENPIEVARILVNGAFGSATQIGYSLFYATPLIFTGLSVAWAFKAGLFNIGAEGQMTLGGLAMAIVGISLSGLPAVVAIPVAFVVAFVVGGLWGALAGWMKAKRGCHEVLTTILLNFVAYGVSSFFILSVFRNRDVQSPETEVVGDGFQIGAMEWLGGTSPLNWSFAYALIAAVLFHFIFKKTRLGFYQRMAGGAPMTGRLAGIGMDRQTIIAMFVSGGLAALAGASPVLGFMFKAREGFSGGAGFVGIAVALLGRNSAFGVVAAAILFGALTRGALDLDLDTEKVSRDLATVIQALIVLAVASQVGLGQLWTKMTERMTKGDRK
ncbi:MAG: ABC transporter permease [Bdellovibrionota bacterium]